MYDGGWIRFFELNGSDESIPFIIRIKNELNSGFSEFRIVIREGYFCSSIGSFTYTNQNFHRILFYEGAKISSYKMKT